MINQFCYLAVWVAVSLNPQIAQPLTPKYVVAQCTVTCIPGLLTNSMLCVNMLVL